ncbi:hypothetical protein [Viridibacillus arvi]|uniref:hypothetical protein n=1 Tax=Viridibacillus arvi TaxID=263475 RepID=UPI0034CF7926
MKKNELYKHFNGELYKFQCIALPLIEPQLPLELRQQMNFIENVTFHENTHEIALFEYKGIYFIESTIPHVIYINVEKQLKWARPVDDFFGYKEKEGKWIKRFSHIETPKEII